MSSVKHALIAAILVAASAPVTAQRTIDLDPATTDVNAAFAKGTLTSERLTQMFLARIDAYDRKGPALRAIITLNPKALETARAMDAERRTKGPRSPLHGIPIVLKDNIDTADLPTTGGSVMLAGSMPPDDAFVVRKLRAAGAVIVAKVNLSEFASGAAHSSLGGQILNPHDLARSPAGSSGGTGASIAAAFAMAAEYLKTIGPTYPKSITELIEQARRVNAPRPDGGSPNPARWSLMMRESASGTLNDYQYTSVRDHALPLVRAILDGIFKANTIVFVLQC